MGLREAAHGKSLAAYLRLGGDLASFTGDWLDASEAAARVQSGSCEVVAAGSPLVCPETETI